MLRRKLATIPTTKHLSTVRGHRTGLPIKPPNSLLTKISTTHQGPFINQLFATGQGTNQLLTERMPKRRRKGTQFSSKYKTKVSKKNENESDHCAEHYSKRLIVMLKHKPIREQNSIQTSPRKSQRWRSNIIDNKAPD